MLELMTLKFTDQIFQHRAHGATENTEGTTILCVLCGSAKSVLHLSWYLHLPTALTVIVWMLLTSAVCFGQSTYLGLKPGLSTRDDVAKALGQPVNKVSETMFEYNPQKETGKIYVEYRKGSPVVDRIEVYFLKPIPRESLIKVLKLPEQAEAKKADSKGRLVEYFGSSKSLAMMYASDEASSGVTRLGYFSQELFDLAVGKSRSSTPSSKLSSLPSEKQFGLKFDVASGQTNVFEGTFTITNICSQRHTIALQKPDNITWLRLSVKDKSEIPPGEIRKVAAQLTIDATNLSVSTYRGEIFAKCLDCTQEQLCTRGMLSWPIELKVTEPTKPKASAPPRAQKP